MSGKPDTIPAWSLDIAKTLVESFGFDHALLEGAIAGALVHQRERCAKLADDHAQALRENFDRSCAIAVEGVAKAIRSPVPASKEAA